MLRTAAKMLFFFAIWTAARPYIEFLVAPPAGSMMRWMITVMALGVAGALATYLFWKKPKEAGEG